MTPEQMTLDRIPVSQMLHAIPDPAWLATSDGRECVYNHQLTHAFGLQHTSPERHWELLHPEDRLWCVERCRQHMAQGDAFELQLRVRNPEGEYVSYQMQVSPVQVDGEVLAWLGTVRPVDQRKALLEGLIEHVPVGLALLDENYHMRVVNPQLAEGTRYRFAEYQDAHLGSLFPETFKQVKPLIDQVFESGKVIPLEYQSLYTVEGEEALHWQITYFPVWAQDGKVLGVGSATQDITSRKKAEQGLQESQEFLHRITEVVPAVINVRDLQSGKTLFSNNHAAAIIGYTLTELESMAESEVVQLFPAEDVPAVYHHYQTVPNLRDGEVLEREFCMRHRDGSWRWIYGKTTIFSRDASGRALTSLSANVDITERKNFELALKASEQQLLRLMETQKRFVSEASHEIKTPLAGIQGNLEVLLRYPHIPEEEKLEILQDCHREATRLGRLVGDLLGMARGNTDLHMIEDDVRLDALLQDAFRELERTRGDRNMQMDAMDACKVLGDPDRLKQLVVILISNAIKYTPEGGNITIDLKNKGTRAELRISDTGIGIPSEDLEKVFERFYRADTAQHGMPDPGGSGLGLSIARWIVEEHRGKIWLESQLGVGTTAVVTLPVLA